METENKGMLYGLLGVIAFGLTLPATKFVIDYLDPIFIGLGRALVASIVAAALLVFSKARLPTPNQFRSLIFISLGVVIGFPVLSAMAMQLIPAAHGGVILGILPLATAAVGSIVSHSRPSKGFWITSLLGCLVVGGYSYLQSSAPTPMTGSDNLQSILLGDVLLLAAVACAAIGYAIGGRLAAEMPSWQVICWALVIAAPLLVWPVIQSLPENLGTLPLSVISAFVYLALISQLFGFFLWYHGLALGGVARVSQMQLLQPFVTILASAWLLAERVSLTTWCFAIAVVLCVAISRKMPISIDKQRL